MKTTVYIPIKLTNERLPEKNLKRFDDGTPLIHLIQKTLLKVDIIDEVYIFCSDDSIQEYVLDGIKYLKRPEFLDRKETLCAEIISEFVKAVPSDIYILAHATSPFVRAETYKKCIEKVQSGEYNSAMAAKRLQKFMWYHGKPLNFDLSNIPRTQDMEPIFLESSSPYVFTKEVFEKFNGRTDDRPYICECSDIETIDIDYPEDFVISNAMYMSILKDEMFK